MRELVAMSDSTSATRVVNALIADAVRAGASDLHVEPAEREVRVRYRIDGQMRGVLSLQRALLPSLVARLKVMCEMDISESRKPQDGVCRVRVDGRPVELRVATLRGVYGEIVVARVLCPEATCHSLDALGMEPGMIVALRRQLALRQGMLLIVGPTGSGKSTTLYASLCHLNDDSRNMITVEDPVEARVAGVNQIQVDERAGRDFATTLRAILRQDPDVIMVGEIRDRETVEIACRAALTGHLVLSTLHTRDAIGTIARLLDMGIDPWLVTSSLNGVLSQRLVRRVCAACAAPYEPPRELLRAIESRYGPLPEAVFRRGRGCATCRGTGTRGRIGIHEMLELDDTLRHLIAQSGESAEQNVRRYVAHYGGFLSMEQDALRKACTGLIPPEELVELGFGIAMAMATGASTWQAMGEAEGAPLPRGIRTLPATPEEARPAYARAGGTHSPEPR